MLLYSLSLCVCTIISFLYDIDRWILPGLSAKKRLCQQRTIPSLISPSSSSSMLSQSYCPFFVSSFHQSAIIPFSIHHIPHRYRSTRTKSVLIIYPTLPPANNPAYHTSSFLSLLHANSYLPFHFALKTYIPSTPSSLSSFSCTCCCRTIHPSLYVHTYYSSLLHGNTRRAIRASSNSFRMHENTIVSNKFCAVKRSFFS